MTENTNEPRPTHPHLHRRTFLKLGAAGTAVAAIGAARSLVAPDLRKRGLMSGEGVFDAASIAFAGAIYTEVFPTSPLILNPFSDVLPVPKALAPVADPSAMKDPWSGAARPPGPNAGQQNSFGNEQHQIWPGLTPPDGLVRQGVINYPNPIVYQIKLQLGTHAFTTSRVRPIGPDGKQATPPPGAPVTLAADGTTTLPRSTIYGFNGTFPGPRINAEYGKPVVVRFQNHLDENPDNLDRQDFGAPDWSFLTHLHNGHTAPESDGNPHYTMKKLNRHGYEPHTWFDAMYLNWPAGNDSNEKQTFFWFHDHRMDHTGSNVYKGMVGLYPIYDPVGGMDMGDENQGLHLPGVRTNNANGTFDVEYDIPMAFYDCRLDDGVTLHQDIHDAEGAFPGTGNPRTHPEWWGKTFYKHFPNHGFVGDIFTVNGTAYPVLPVERRKYRLRFLDASLARIYEFKLMSSTRGPVSAASLGLGGSELQGQWRIPDGQQCMRFTQIATDGGLIPVPITRDSFELWPAKRREFIVDFSKYQDGTPTTKGDAVYLTNIMKMPDGRLWSNSSRFSPDPNYKVPVLKFVIGDLPKVPDKSVIPAALRPIPQPRQNWQSLLNTRMIFEVQRGGAGGETEWLVNGVPFDPANVVRSLKNPAGQTPLAQQKLNSFNLWEIRNGGGGWVHPFHLHMEEHRTLMRNGKATVPDAGHPDDLSKEDLGALDPSESVVIWRGFRDFTGPYVAHCHNLAHEDHAMMFGWEIVR